MMPIFSCGAVMRSPSSTTAPSLGGSSPPMARSNVDLPEPEPPITATISPSSTSSDTPPSACTPLGYVLPTRSSASIGLVLSHDIFPAQERRSDKHDQPIGRLADDGEGDDGGDDLRRLAELLAVDQQIAETFGSAHQLGGDDEHPAETEARPQRNHIGRQNRRQQNAAHHFHVGQPERAADFDQLAVDRLDRAHQAEINRKEHADRDQRHFRRFENPEPEN